MRRPKGLRNPEKLSVVSPPESRYDEADQRGREGYGPRHYAPSHGRGPLRHKALQHDDGVLPQRLLRKKSFQWHGGVVHRWQQVASDASDTQILPHMDR